MPKSTNKKAGRDGASAVDDKSPPSDETETKAVHGNSQKDDIGDGVKSEKDSNGVVDSAKGGGGPTAERCYADNRRVDAGTSAEDGEGEGASCPHGEGGHPSGSSPAESDPGGKSFSGSVGGGKGDRGDGGETNEDDDAWDGRTFGPGGGTGARSEGGAAACEQAGPTANPDTDAVARPRQPPSSAAQTTGGGNGADDDDFDDDYSDGRDTLLTMSFNQDGGCLAVGTGSGFRICNVSPFQETFRRNLGGGGGEEGGGGIAGLEMLFRTNLLALTGRSSSPRYPPNKVLIYDDHLQRTIGELSFRQRVLTTKMRRDRIVVVLRDRVYIYNFADLALLDKVHTGDNPLGLIGISMDNGGVGGSTASVAGVERAEDALGASGNSRRNNGMVLACPSTHRGQVRVELYGLRRTTFVDAHESALGALALSVDGSLLATASERGTVIRLFDTRGITVGGGSGGGAGRDSTAPTAMSSSTPLREFRRGVERATVSCLTFSLDSNWLGCASNHGTVHLFQTHDPEEDDARARRRSGSSSMTGRAMRMLPKLVSAPRKYLMEGAHSYAQVRGVPHPRACAFVPDRERTVAVAGTDEHGNGCLLLAEFGPPSSDGDPNGPGGGADYSEARRLGYHRFFKRKSPAGQRAPRGRAGRSGDDAGGRRARENAADAEGGAYIDDVPVDVRMNHISIGDENEDDFVPIDYNDQER